MENQGTAVPREILNRWLTIEDRLDEIQRKVATDEASIHKRISEWGGVVALVISIAVGGFTLLDQGVFAPKERRSDALSELNDIVIEIARTNVAIMEAFSRSPGGSGNDPAVGALSIGQQANAIKLPLLARAVEIVEDYPAYVDAATLLVLVTELTQAQDYDRAVRYADMARATAPLINLRIEATRMMGVANTGLLDETRHAAARRLFEEAIAAAKQVKSVNGPWLVANALRDWTTFELMVGNCAAAAAVFARFQTDVALPIGQAALATGAGFVLQSAQLMQTCPADTLPADTLLEPLGGMAAK